MKGNITTADWLLSSQTSSGVLYLSQRLSNSTGKTVWNTLIKKHPAGSPVYPDAVLDSVHQEESVHPVLFEGTDSILIRNMALKSRGSSGPSGMNALDWKRLCMIFHGPSKALCNAIASVARRICIEYVDLTCCCIVLLLTNSLNKNPGVRPIGICETVRRVLGKAILAIVGSDVQKATGFLQLCASQSSGCEAAVQCVQFSMIWSQKLFCSWMPTTLSTI